MDDCMLLKIQPKAVYMQVHVTKIMGGSGVSGGRVGFVGYAGKPAYLYSEAHKDISPVQTYAQHRTIINIIEKAPKNRPSAQNYCIFRGKIIII